jgi:predicted phage baseplate assembly protein
VILPEPTLDDRSFQELVNEARARVALQCPEWTEHNVSDPGITLIETFAWMTEMLTYRLNRVPDRMHVALLRLLDIELAAPAASEVDLRFHLTAPAERRIAIPATTEVTTAVPGDNPIVFHVSEAFDIEPVRPAALLFQRSGVEEEVHVADDGTATPDRPAFSTPPAVDDAIQLGFEQPIGRLVMRVTYAGNRARGEGVDPDMPPLAWEVLHGDGWVPAEVLEDTTAGFNTSSGDILLQIPPETTADAMRKLHWLRCRVDRLTRPGTTTPRYTGPPHIDTITARPVGALVPAEHAEVVEKEELGTSDGTPGQTFRVGHSPALELRADETLEVLEPGSDDWEPWERRDSFDATDREDRHFRFDPAAGEVELGPAIRERRRAWRYYGAIPPKGSRLRMTRYRHGGGERGDVARDSLRRLRTPIADVESVTNPNAAEGGWDAETLEAARRRAALELRTRYRAVTPADFEFLAQEGPAKVGRARCLEPGPREAVPVYVLPTVPDPDRLLLLDDLEASAKLLKAVTDFLDERRVVGTAVHVMPAGLRGVTAVVDVVVEPSANPSTVEERIKGELYRFLNPFVGGVVEGQGDGWPFGRPLAEGELYALVHEVPGVERIRTVRMYETDPATPDKPLPRQAGPRIELAPEEVVCSGMHRVRAERRDAV